MRTIGRKCRAVSWIVQVRDWWLLIVLLRVAHLRHPCSDERPHDQYPCRTKAESAARDPKTYSPNTPPAISKAAITVTEISLADSSFRLSPKRTAYSTTNPTNTAKVHQPDARVSEISAALSASEEPTGYYYFIALESRRRLFVGFLAFVAALFPLLFLWRK
jgi:hypothetical protein